MISDNDLKLFAKLVEIDERAMTEIVPEKLQEMMFLYKELSDILQSEEVSIEITTNEPVESMGFIKVNFNWNIQFEDMNRFCNAASTCANMELVTGSDGSASIYFTFHGLKRRPN